MNLTPEQAALASNAPAILQAARAYLQHNYPYLMTTIYGMVPVEDYSIPTAAVSRQLVMRYNPIFVGKLTYQEMAGVYWHEASHVIRRHLYRHPNEVMTVYELQILNIAQDMAINPDLRKAGIKLPSFAVYPEKYGLPEGLTSEEYYSLLLKDPPPSLKIKMLGDSGGDGKEDEEGDNGGVCAGGCGGVAGNKEDEKGEELNESLGRTPADIDGIIRKTAADIAQHASQGRGNVPGGLQELANLILEPTKVSWRAQLDYAIRRASGKVRSGGMDLSLRRPSKRGLVRGLLRPGLIQRSPEICIIRDTSGSMGHKQIQEGTSEASHSCKAAGVDQAWFLDADTEVAFAKRVSIAQIPTLPVHGRGGTSFDAAILHALKLKPKPDVIIYFTDGDGHVRIPAPEGVEVIWCVVNSYYNKPPAPWGHTILLADL